MGQNPHKQGPTPPRTKQFDITLFNDVYAAMEDKFGKDFMGRYCGVASIFFNGKGEGRIECRGTIPILTYLVTMLMMRLAITQADAIKKATNGKHSPRPPDVAREIMRSIQESIDKKYPLVDSKKGPGIARSGQ